MKKDVPPLDLEALPRLSIAELRDLWPQHMGRSEPPRQKCLLIRELAWRTQAAIHSGLDRQTQALLRTAMREAAKRATPSQGEPSETPPQKRRNARSAPALPQSTRLVRVWGGKRHEVDVLGKQQFRYRGQVYGSLSEIARVITGAHWSGPRFFGIMTRRANDESQDR